MRDYEIPDLVKTLSGETSDVIVSAFISLATQKVLHRLYPFDDSVEDVPDRYLPNVVEIAVFLLNKRGAEGESYHSENGIIRTYEGADVPESMYKGITPFCEVI